MSLSFTQFSSRIEASCTPWVSTPTNTSLAKHIDSRLMVVDKNLLFYSPSPSLPAHLGWDRGSIKLNWPSTLFFGNEIEIGDPQANPLHMLILLFLLFGWLKNRMALKRRARSRSQSLSGNAKANPRSDRFLYFILWELGESNEGKV